MRARDLDRVLDRLRAGIGEDGPLFELAGDQRVQLLGQLDEKLVRRRLEGDVGKVPDLFPHRLDHTWVGVPDVHGADAPREVYENVAVHVREEGAASLLDEDGDSI